MKIFFVCWLSWLVAQIIKVIINAAKIIYHKRKGETYKKITVGTFFKLGGMPSSHTATVVALCSCILFRHGFHSDYFAISGVFAFITMFDARMVRLPVSRLTDSYNALQKKVLGDKAVEVKKVEGHTVPEIIGGFIVGLTMAYIMTFVVGFIPLA